MNDSNGPNGSSRQDGFPPDGSAPDAEGRGIGANDSALADLESTVRAVGGTLVQSTAIEYDQVVAFVAQGNIKGFLERCKVDPALGFEMLVDITVIDWMDEREARFEVAYQLLGISASRRLGVRVAVSEDDPIVDSVTSLWAGANFMEREAWDMFGIQFRGHPDLRRILMYDEFVGHPLRKDYPVQGKQPRIPLRMPEVENTARNMHRPELVKIRSKRDERVEQR